MLHQTKLALLFGFVALAAVASLLVGAASLSASQVMTLLVSFQTTTLLFINTAFLALYSQLALELGSGYQDY